MDPSAGTDPHDPRAAGRAAGARHARRFVDDTLEGATLTFSLALEASGVARLRVVDAFHRSVLVRVEREAPDDDFRLYVQSAFESFLSEAFNCEARAAWTGETLRADLLEGRDVNRRRPA